MVCEVAAVVHYPMAHEQSIPTPDLPIQDDMVLVEGRVHIYGQARCDSVDRCGFQERVVF